MRVKTTLAVCAAAAAMLFAAPQGASALPQVNDAKQATQGNVEKAGYYGRRHRGWRHRYYRRDYYGYPRRYYRRPGFGVYLGF